MSKSIKANLAYLRFMNGRLTQKAVSEATGIGQKTLSALETGASKGIEFSTLIKLCDFFHCTPGELLLIEEEAEVAPPSKESLLRAKHLVAQGLSAAMLAEPKDPEEIWKDFDSVRVKLQEAAELDSDNQQAEGQAQGA